MVDQKWVLETSFALIADHKKRVLKMKRRQKKQQQTQSLLKVPFQKETGEKKL